MSKIQQHSVTFGLMLMLWAGLAPTVHAANPTLQMTQGIEKRLKTKQQLTYPEQRTLLKALRTEPESALKPYWIYALAQSNTAPQQVLSTLSARDGLRAHFYWWRAMSQSPKTCGKDFGNYSKTIKNLPAGVPMPLIPDSTQLQKQLPCIEKLPESQRLSIASVAKQHRYFWLLPRILKDVKTPEALFLQGENHLLMRKYARAAASFAKIVQHPAATGDLKKRAVIQAGLAEHKRKRYKQANTWWKWISTTDKTYYPEVLWHQGQWNTLIQNHRTHDRTPDALGQRIEKAVTTQRLPEVERLARQLVTGWPQHETADQARYWLARSLQKHGKVTEARQWYTKQSQQALNNYYTQMSICRLNNENCFALQNKPLKKREPDLPFLKREPLLKQLVAQKNTSILQVISPFVALDNKERDLLTSYAYRYNGHYFRSIRTIWRQQTRDVNVLRLMYPLHYDALQKENAKRYQIPQALIAGLTWQESMYKANIRSVSGARGLMQLMPRTALGSASKAGLKGLRLSQLDDPKINIRLGSYYLKAQVKRTNGNLMHMAASYNGGPNAVAKWIKKFGPIDADVFVERIPYAETRRYAKQVTTHTRVYNQIYR